MEAANVNSMGTGNALAELDAQPAIDHVERSGKTHIEPRHEAEDARAKDVDNMATTSLYVSCRP